MDDERQIAPSVARNREAIRGVLREILPHSGDVLEIASGSGEHVVFFARAFPDLRFHPSDPDEAARRSVAAWSADSGLDNIAPPRALDVARSDWGIERADAILCINMIHISPWRCCEGLIAGAGERLSRGAPLFLYGPYKRNGAHTAPSNVDFDAWLKNKNSEYGVRDLEAVIALAQTAGFDAPDVIDMPANNFSLVFRRA
jgi:hypothetical protein